MEIALNTIPTWLVAAVMLYTGYIWLITREHEIRMDSRIVAWTLILQGMVYIVNNLWFDGNITEIERILTLRFIIIEICLAQSVPLSVSYFRAKKRGK
jgi:hypothetical protein